MVKKLIIGIMLTAVLSMSLTACGDKTENSGGTDNSGNTSVVSSVEEKTADLKAVLSEINTKFASSTGNLRELTDTAELEKYYSIPADVVKQFGAEISADTNAPVEIILVEANDESRVEKVKKALDIRYNSIYNIYASYSAEQLETVKACKVTVSGNYVTLVVAPEYEKIMEVVNAAIS